MGYSSLVVGFFVICAGTRTGAPEGNRKQILQIKMSKYCKYISVWYSVEGQGQASLGGNRKGNTFATLLLATLSATSYEDGGIDDDGNGVAYVDGGADCEPPPPLLHTIPCLRTEIENSH